MVDDAHGGDDGVEGKDYVHHGDGGHGTAQGERGLGRVVGVPELLALGRQGEHLLDLGDALVDQVGAADQQDDAFARDLQVHETQGDGAQGLGEVHDPAEGEQQRDAGDHGRRQAELSPNVLLALLDAVRRNRDEHDVVDAQDNLEEREHDKLHERLGGRKRSGQFG